MLDLHQPTPLNKTDKVILGLIFLLLVWAAAVSWSIYKRPQFDEVSKLIAIEAPVTLVEKSEIRQTLEDIKGEISKASATRERIIALIEDLDKDIEKGHAVRLELQREHAHIIKLLNDGPE